MEKFVQGIVDKLLRYKLVDVEEKENYGYYIEIVLEKIIGMGSIFLMAFIMKKEIEIIFFLFSFSAIRRYSGGFHCKSFWKCYLLSLLVCNISICPLFIDSICKSKKDTLIITLLSLIVIFMIGAVNHPNMNWSILEMQHSKDMARGMTALLGGLVFSFVYLDLLPQYRNYFAEGIWVNAGSVLVAKILRQKVRL